MKKWLKRFFYFFIILLFFSLLYSNALLYVNSQAKSYLDTLKLELKKEKLSPNLFVISGKRYHWDNWFLSKFGGAAKKSQHLKGNAIDIIVLDVNGDGTANALDVDLVFKTLDKKIIRNKGGIGTYKNESGFFNRQMIHFDCRGKKARWHR